MESRTSLAFSGISKKFGSVVALRDFSLDVSAGELVSLLGPSGCGKTTALRIAAGFETKDSGSLYLNNREISQMPANQRGIGMVFQSYSLFPHLSVEGNVAFGLKIKGLTRDQIEIRVRSVLERVQLLALRDRFPHQLSGGQQQRVALARALAIEPNVLLLDEPLSALDAKVRHELRTEIRRLQTEAGVATLFVTHDQEEAMAISDRIVVMNNGVVQQIGTPVEVYMSPNNSFVARFVGAMNELTVTVMDSRMVSLFGQEHALGVSARHGERLTVLVRPDAVRIVPHEAVGSIPASVSEVVFAGSATVVRCSVEYEGTAFHLESVVWSRELVAKPGDRVGLEVDLRHALIDRTGS